MKIHIRLVASVLAGLLTVAALTVSIDLDRPPRAEQNHKILNVELGGVCGTLIGAGVTAASFVKEAMTKVKGGWAGAAVAAGCLLHDAVEYRIQYEASPERIAELQEIQRRWAGYRTYDDLMSRGFGCDLREYPPTNPDDVASETTYSWDCSHSPYKD